MNYRLFIEGYKPTEKIHLEEDEEYDEILMSGDFDTEHPMYEFYDVLDDEEGLDDDYDDIREA